MADDLAVSPATAAFVVAADLIGGALYQRTKLSLGADGAAVDAVAGAGNSSTATQRVTLATDDVNGAAINASAALLDDAVAGHYETVAKSQTAQVLGATGATGDYIKRLVIIPETTAPGQVLLLDNAISITVWVGGTVGADLKPFTVDLDMRSVSGAWKVTTGDNVHVIGIGKFTA